MAELQRLRAAIREEVLTQKALAIELEMPLRTLEDYLSGKTKLSGELMFRITNHPRFTKYTLWLMTGRISSTEDQVAPTPTTLEKCGISVDLPKK